VLALRALVATRCANNGAIAISSFASQVGTSLGV